MSKESKDVLLNNATEIQDRDAYAVSSNRNMLLGRHFTLITDHRNIICINQPPSDMIARWQIALGEYDYQLRHVPGRYITLADRLSRLFELGSTNISSSTIAPF
jgi:hypothetical protein